MKHKKISLGLALALTLLLSTAHSTLTYAATTWTVTRLDDRNNASCVAGDCSLREAINSANAGAGGDTINFASGLNGTIILTLDRLPLIGNSVTIDGGGMITVSGANNYRIVAIFLNATLTLNNIILTNGYANGDGGAVYVASGTLVLNNSTVQNSKTNGQHGGAIFAFASGGDMIILNNSIVQGNSGYDYGAIYSTGAVTLNNSIMRIISRRRAAAR